MEKKFIYTTAIKKIRAMKSRVKILQGGTSASKTYGVLSVLADKAMKNNNLEISVVSKSFPHLRSGAIRDFINIMKITNRYNEKNWNITTSTYTFSSGSYIEFFAAHDLDRVIGPRRDILYVNEANHIPFERYEQMAIRSQEIYIDFNPTGRFWAHDKVLVKPNAEMIILTYRDNEALSKSIIEELEYNRILAETSDYYKNWCKVYLDGEIGNVEGVCIPDWKEVDRIPEEARLLGYGLDFGFHPDPAAIVAVYKMDGEIYVDERLYQTGVHNPDLHNFIKLENIKGEIIADSAEPKSISELKRFGHNVIPVSKKDGGSQSQGSVRFGISLLNTLKINVTSRSYNLINELQNYTWKVDGNGNQTSTPTGADHAIDALRYFAMMRLGNRNNNQRTFRI